MAELKSFFVEEKADGTKKYTKCFTCAHCSKIVAVPDVTQDRGFCIKCFHHTCLACGGSERCTPFERKIEAMEAAARQRSRFFDQLT